MYTLPHRSAAIRLGIACAALLAASAVAARAEEVTKSFAVIGRANVRVETNDGSVRVTSGDSKQVEFRVEYQGYELGKNLRVDARQDGDKVELTARVTGRWGFSFGHNSRHLHIEVRIPREADLHAETGDRSVDLVLQSDFQTNIDASTGDGHISLGIAVTVEGTFKNSELHGKMNGGGLPLTIHTGDGSIRLSKS